MKLSRAKSLSSATPEEVSGFRGNRGLPYLCSFRGLGFLVRPGAGGTDWNGGFQ